MDKGDIVLITFPFTDLSGSKMRPAVVLTDTELDVTACFITTHSYNGKSQQMFNFWQHCQTGLENNH